MNIAPITSTLQNAELMAGMSSGFLMGGGGSPNIVEQAISTLRQATVPLHYAVMDPSLPWQVAAPARDGYSLLTRAQSTLEYALYSHTSSDELWAASNAARTDIDT